MAAEVAAVRAAETRADIERTQALADLRREQDAARQTAAAEAAREARNAKRDRDRERRAERAERRQRRAASWQVFAGRVRLLVPLLVVNGEIGRASCRERV